jgi:hypothetical protein
VRSARCAPREPGVRRAAARCPTKRDTVQRFHPAGRAVVNRWPRAPSNGLVKRKHVPDIEESGEVTAITPVEIQASGAAVSNPEVPMLQPQSRSAAVCVDKSPLLRSIAIELRERTRAVRELEAKQQTFTVEPVAHHKELADITACLAVHRREIRLAQKEIERLGWIVEELSPLQLVRIDLESAEQLIWPLTDTGFYRNGG